MNMNMKKSPKLKPVPRSLFTCGIFRRNCTQSVPSPTSLSPPPPPPPPPQPSSSSSSSSSSTSPSITQWRFPAEHAASPSLTQLATSGGAVFRAAEAHFRSQAPVAALRVLEKGMANSESGGLVCPPEVMAGVTAALRDPVTARPAAKVLLAMVLVEPNRRAAVEAGAVEAAVEAIVASGGGSNGGASAAERALAALELMCMTEEGLSQVRSHALSAPAAISGAVLQGVVQGRGRRECGIGVLAAAFGGERAKDAPDEVVRAVVVAMQGECSARGRRKGAMLMRAWQECGRLDLFNVNFDGWVR